MKRLIFAFLFALAGVPVHAANLKVLFAFTPTAYEHFAPFGLPASAQPDIDAMNGSFSRGGVVSQSVSAAAFTQITSDYDVDSAGVYGASQNIALAYQRDVTGADVVVVVSKNGNGVCGYAQEIGASAEHAYVVISWTCLGNNVTVAHEVGHLLGLRHQTPNGYRPDTTVAPSPYTNGHGYITDSLQSGLPYCYYDIMANQPTTACASAPSVPFQQSYIYSSPSYRYCSNSDWVDCHPGAYAGSAGYSFYADAGGTLGTSLPIAANFHAVKLTPRVVAKALAVVWQWLF